jgi:hypothetical protein
MNQRIVKPVMYSSNQVEVCTKDYCLRAHGKNADRIAAAASFMLICAGLSLLISSAR